MKKLFKLAIFTIAFTALFASCSDPSSFGAELLEEDRSNLEFVDTFSISASVEPGDSVRTHTPFASLGSYLCGQMEDPLTGTSTSRLFAQLLPEFYDVDFGDAELDSVVLVLAYDTNAVYGQFDEMYGIDVYELAEELDDEVAYYSDTTISVIGRPLTTHMFFPSFDSLEVFDYASGVVDTVSYPHLRIPLNEVFGQAFLDADTSVYSSGDDFLEFFKGFSLQATDGKPGMLAFNLFTQNSGLFLYYTRNDTLKRQFQFEFNSLTAKVLNFEHDYSGTLAEQLQTNTELTDSIVLVQGMEGLRMKLDFPGLTNLTDVIINRAELEVSVLELDNDLPDVFLPAEQIIASYRDPDDGVLKVIDDVTLVASALTDRFGGFPGERGDGEPLVYRFNITTHVQDMIDGTVPTELIFTVSPLAERASRTVFYGPGRSDYPMKLKLTVTKL